MHIEVKKWIYENSGYNKYMFIGNSCFIGYELLKKDRPQKRPRGTLLVNECINKLNSKEKNIYMVSSNFLQRNFASPSQIFKNNENIGYADLRSREFFIHINNIRYEISRHKNNLSSVMKDDIQFALIIRSKENLYEVNFDETIVRELPLILLLTMYADKFYKITRRTMGGDGIWFDYKESRTDWTPSQ